MATQFPDQDEYPEIDEAFDEDAWNYLYLHYPRIADAVLIQVQRGKDMGGIPRHIVRKYGGSREEISIRIAAAARHLMAVKR